MPIFHEIYSVYFRIVSRLLEREHLTDQEVSRYIQEEGFRDSVLFLPQKLLPQRDHSDWGLLRREPDGTLAPVTKHRPPRTLTRLQKRWLRTWLDDPRMGLFLSESEQNALRNKLADAEPLNCPDMLRYHDQFSDGDDYGDPHYRKHFREILLAIREKRVLDVSYVSGHDRGLRAKVVPFRLEYSEKNDKFRAYCIRLEHGKAVESLILNLGRIRSLSSTPKHWNRKLSPAQWYRMRRCAEPVTVCITPARNAVERFLMEFASYEKRTDRDTETGVVTVRLWYDRNDETELLIRLLGFGPVLEIIGPADFRAKAAERLRRQMALLREREHADSSV